MDEGEYADNLKTHYKQLRGLPNSNLTGDTFDARHLDRFLQTEHGEKGAQFVPQDAQMLKYGGNFTNNQEMKPIQTNIRPDPCFLTVPRQIRKDTNYGVNPKPPQFSQVKVNVLDKSPYQKEYKKIDELKGKYDPNKLNFDQEKTGLMSHFDRRNEIEEIKKNRQNFHEFKDAHSFGSKRDRIVKSGWKNGIVGVDSVMNPNTFFYKDQQKKMVDIQTHSDEINERNKAGKGIL